MCARVACLVLLSGVGCMLLSACQSPPKREPAPAETGQPAPAPTSRPSESPTVPQVQPEPYGEPGFVPEVAPKEPANRTEYVQVLERFHPDEPASAEVHITSRHRLVIDTRNVRRLRILRRRLPMDIDQSIVLRLDDQGMEWTASSEATEFERGNNGGWSAVPPRKP